MQNMMSEMVSELAEIRRTLQEITIHLARKSDDSNPQYNVADLAKELNHYMDKRKDSRDKTEINMEERLSQFIDELAQDYLQLYNAQTVLFAELNNEIRNATWKNNKELVIIIELVEKRLRKIIKEQGLFQTNN